ncbi:MAG: hypothetical protein R3F11_10735 [Verrucomicrobiales bacterium]
MKTLALILTVLAAAAANPTRADEVTDALREAYKLYENKDLSGATEKVREVLEKLEAKSAKLVGEVLPPKLGDWQGANASKENTAFIGGGVSVANTYRKGNAEVTVKIIRDSPLMDGIAKLLSNKDVLKFSGLKTESIGGETAVIQGEGADATLRLAVEGILVEVKGGRGADDSDLVAVARKLDLNLLKKLAKP